jgi:hypothetical protein
MDDKIEMNISGGVFHGPVAAIMENCTSIIKREVPGARRESLETLQTQVAELISRLPPEHEQLKQMSAQRLKEIVNGVTSGHPERAWYSVSASGLLEAAKFVKDFSGEIAGTLKNLGNTFWADFTLP